jgi:HEAT repeat protein
MADIHFECPHCNQPLDVRSDMAGECVPCPTCEMILLVPAVGPKAVDACLEALADASPKVRQGAVEALSALRADARAVPALIAMTRDEDGTVRWLAAFALRKVTTGDAIEPLALMLWDANSNAQIHAYETLRDNDWQPANERQRVWLAVIRSDVATLTRIGKPAVEPLITCLQIAQLPSGWTPIKNVLSTAVTGLGEIGDVRAVEPLIAILESSGKIGLLGGHILDELVNALILLGIGCAAAHALMSMARIAVINSAGLTNALKLAELRAIDIIQKAPERILREMASEDLVELSRIPDFKYMDWQGDNDSGDDGWRYLVKDYRALREQAEGELARRRKAQNTTE